MAKSSRTKKTTRKRTASRAGDVASAKGEGAAGKSAKPPTSAAVAARLADDAGISKKQARTALKSLGAMMQESLAERGVFVLPGIAKASVLTRPATAARIGRHPVTKQEIQVPAGEPTRTVRVRVTRRLRDQVLGE